MTEYFKVLSDSEFDQLKDAISLITVYIAGADGNINDDETKWAEKVTKIRSYTLPQSLKEFYAEVGIDFHERMENYMASLSNLETRNSTVADKLTALNPILAKLAPKLGATLYNSYLSFAKHVAKASGGFLGFFSIGPKEAALLDLEMITPIVWEEEEEV
ncbi:MAG: hypothetical protein ACI86M_003335 [Saprospiraceae bacterium]|jgi:hypothetical protein